MARKVTPRRETIKATTVVNRVLGELAGRIQDMDLPAFGPELCDVTDAGVLASAVVKHRICSKFMLPDARIEMFLHQKAISEMIAHDESKAVDFSFAARAQLEPLVRKAVYQARLSIGELFEGFRPTYRFRPPSGESAKSNGGLTDVMYKLEDTSHWEVSLSAVPYASAICYNNSWLKRTVKAHFNRLAPTGRPPLDQKREWYEEWVSSKPGMACGFFVFQKMFLSLCSVNDVVRVTSIPKNAKARRVISMVPFWNMVCQLSLMGDMRAVLERRWGIYLSRTADLHKTLIRHRHKATIDLSNASNSVWGGVVDFLFPRGLTKWFDRIVNRHYETTLDRETVYGVFNMFSPMGVGVTFDVMTIMLTALSRVLDPGASVFGDDIIIRQECATDLYAILEGVGLVVNETKSFVRGAFSESCGGYYCHLSKRDIVCYDFTFCENDVESFAAVNKLGRIVNAGQVTHALWEVLEEAHARLLRALSRFAVDSSQSMEEVPSRVILAPRHLVPVRTGTAVSRLCSLYWQRAVNPVPMKHLRRRTRARCETTAALACYFLRGGSYEPPSGDEILVTEIADSFSLSPLAGVLMVSVL